MKLAIPIYVVVSLGSYVVEGFPSPDHTSRLEGTSNLLTILEELKRSKFQSTGEKRQLSGSLTAPIESISLSCNSSERYLTRE
jgi:hypothetical protein